MPIRVTVRQRPDRDNLQLAYTDPITGRTRTRSANTINWKKAERAAANWESELQSFHGLASTSWEIMRRRFADEHLANLSKSSISNYMYALNKFEKLVGKPRDVNSINASVISNYAAKLRHDLPSQSSVATNLILLRTCLNWAERIGLLSKAPKFRIPEIESRGRPLHLTEFFDFVQRLRWDCKDWDEADALTRLAMVMWLGGLRISEALKLSFTTPPVRVDWSGKFPAIAWSKGGQKSKRIERTPIAPDFAKYLSRLRPQVGQVVGTSLASKTISTRFQIAGQGEITSHDLRRSFGTRHALRVHPLALKALMRHKAIETTLKYYVDLELNDVSEQIWNGLAPAHVHAHVHERASHPPLTEKRTRKKPRKNGGNR